MKRRHPIRRRLLACALALLPALALSSLAAGPAIAAGPQQSIVYKGEVTFSVTDQSADEGGWESTEDWHYSFAMSAGGNLSEAPAPWSVASFSGTWGHSGTKETQTHPEAFSCGGLVVQDPNEPERTNPPAIVARSGSGWSVSVPVPPGIEEGHECGVGEATSGPQNVISRWITGPFEVDFPREGSYTKPVEATADCTIGPGCVANTAQSGTLQSTLKAELSFSSGGAAPPSQPGPTNPPQGTTQPHKGINKDVRKHDAGKDLDKAVKDALAPCAVAGYGSLAAATKGGVLTGSLGGKGAAGALANAGKEAFDAWRDQCDAAIKRIKADWKTAEDPPLGSWRVLAKVPRAVAKGASCDGRQGTRAKLCEWAASQAALVAAARRSAALAGQIERTIDRETGALEAADKQGAAAQRAEAATLGKAFDAATEAQDNAEGAFAAALRKAGFKLDLTKASRGKAGKLIAGKLAAAGISRADLARFHAALPG